MIIEFIGVSGVGKTTVAKKYKEKLETEGKEVIWDTYDLYANHGWLYRNLCKGLAVFRFAITHHKWIIEYNSFLKSNISDSTDLIKPLFNAIFMISRLEMARTDTRIHLFDEGSLQYLWGVKLRGANEVTDDDICTISKLFGLPDVLISVEADTDTIVNRIKDRGEYVRIMDNGELKASVYKMQEVQNTIKRLVNEKTHVNVYCNN